MTQKMKKYAWRPSFVYKTYDGGWGQLLKVLFHLKIKKQVKVMTTFKNDKNQN